MKYRFGRVVTLGMATLLRTGVASAHYMTEPYVLPVPFWLYVYACSATLLVTFAILGYFFGVSSVGPKIRLWEVPSGKPWALLGRVVKLVLRAGSVALLILTIATALFGSLDSTLNASMTLFWVVFLLGLSYASAVIGNVFEFANPWRVVIEWFGALFRVDIEKGRFKYPMRLGYYPAFAFYLVLIWSELFVLPNPFYLGKLLSIYSLIIIVGVWLYGAAAWFQYAEIFSVFFRMIGTIAPVDYVRAAPGASLKVRLRAPFSGAITFQPDHASLVLFVLFMLASTAYDAVYDTEAWQNLYWRHLIPLAQPLLGIDMAKASEGLMSWFLIYKRGGLFLAPFLYLALYYIVILWTRALTKTTLTTRQLAQDFIASLIPIAFVYNVAHYYTLLVGEIVKVPWLLSNPFGFEWDLFGLGERSKPTYIDVAIIWHTQVGLILVGHVVSVYLAHIIALRVFPTRKAAVLSQIPMLLLMVAYTAIGLYLLSLPLAVAQLRGD
jgi:hypothetical protein